MMEIRKTCPFGHKCEDAKDGYIERCALYIPMRGTNVNTGAEEDRFDCSFNWQAVLPLEAAQASRGVAAAVESLRNESTKRQDAALRSIREVTDAKAIQSS